MSDLQAQIERTRQRNLKRLKRNYDLAKSLGFSSYEANVLAQRSQDKIKELAEERNNGS